MGRVSTPVLVSSPSKVKLAHMVGSFIPILVAGLLPLAIVCWSIVRYFPPGPEDPSYLFTAGRTIWERGGGGKKFRSWWNSNPDRSDGKREFYQLS